MSVEQTSLLEFFREGITRAQARQRLPLQETTQYYVVNLLTQYLDAEKLFGASSTEERDLPLAMIYARACESKSPTDRYRLMKEIGDRSLYVSGFFPDSFRRKLIDVDYYIAMGETAYSYVSTAAREAVFAKVFGELAVKFQRLVDVIGEISEESGITSDSDLLRLYERWMATKSERLSEKLRERGIIVVDMPKTDDLQ